MKQRNTPSKKYTNRGEHRLSSVWTVWAHDKEDENFTKSSYKKCYTITTIEDMWRFFNNIQDFSRHQLYFMRNNIQPKYECPENKNGGSCSVCVQHSGQVKNVLESCIVRLISEQFLPARYCHQITGLYMAPKLHGALIKLWFTDYNWLMQYSYLINLQNIQPITAPRYKKHLEKLISR